LGSAKHRSGFALCGILLHHSLPALQTYGLLIRAVKPSPILNVMRNKTRKITEFTERRIRAAQKAIDKMG